MSGTTLASGTRVVGDREPGELRKTSIGGFVNSLRVIELQLVAFIVVFSASGLVPLVDLAFPVFITGYAFFLATRFPHYSKDEMPPEVFKGSRLFQLYVMLGTLIGLFLPLAYVLGGFARGDRDSVRAATPHLFLLSVQILSENIISGLALFSPPVRALLPIFYTARRLIALSTWLHVTLVVTKLPPHADFQRFAWVWFGRSLAIANFVYYIINLFGFLVPLFLPRAFERYFKDRERYFSGQEQQKTK